MLACHIPANAASSVLITDLADHPSQNGFGKALPSPNNKRKWYQCHETYTRYLDKFDADNDDSQNVVDFRACAEVVTSSPDLPLQYMCYYFIMDKLSEIQIGSDQKKRND